jgi:hypothetical protein
MATVTDRVSAAWKAPNRGFALNLVVESMAAEGISRAALDEALGRLLDAARAAGADDETEEIILGVGDRLHGWCQPSRRITTRPAEQPTPPPSSVQRQETPAPTN